MLRLYKIVLPAVNGEEIAQMSTNWLKTNVFFSIDDTLDFNLQNYQEQLRFYMKQNGALLLVQDSAIEFISSHLYCLILSAFFVSAHLLLYPWRQIQHLLNSTGM